MSIESFFDYENLQKDDILICKFVANGKTITHLRTISFLEKMRETMLLFRQEKVSRCCLYFHVGKMKMPTNFNLLKEYSEIFKQNKDILEEKLQFTIIQSSNNVFRMFFKLFKQFYTPIKPMYLCKNDEQTENCLNHSDSRSNLPTFNVSLS